MRRTADGNTCISDLTYVLKQSEVACLDVKVGGILCAFYVSTTVAVPLQDSLVLPAEGVAPYCVSSKRVKLLRVLPPT